MNLGSERGLTVAELLVAMTLSSILFLATLQVYDASTRKAARTERTVDAANRAHAAVANLVRGLGDASGWNSSGTAFTAVLLRRQPSDIVFHRVTPGATATTGNPRALQSVRFCLDAATGRLLEQRGPVDVLPSIACPDPAWTRRTLVTDVRNPVGTPVFAYDTAGPDVTGVSIAVGVDVNPAAPPEPQVVRSGVRLRNQNRVPSAAFTAVPAASRHVQLNASTSQDPEAQYLTYAWRDGTTAIGDGRPVFDYIAPESGARTITLTVTDPEQRSASTSQTVTVLP